MSDDPKVRQSFALLEAADLFFGEPGWTDENERWERTINFNDVWGWATADGEFVPDECAQELHDLFYRYGWCGVLYWASERRGGERSEFAYVNRFIEFVRNEEALRKREPSSSKRAYTKLTYTIGELP